MIPSFLGALALMVPVLAATSCSGEGAGASGSPPPLARGQSDDACRWRRCDLERGPLQCASAEQVCDVVRNVCVPDCQGHDCCADVRCPAGAACVPAVGRCGAPAGPACFDMGTSWWTGRDLPPGRTPAATAASPVTIEILNDTGRPLYFQSTQAQQTRVDIAVRTCGEERRLEIPENHYCVCACPAQGPPTCRDCGPPARSARRLEPGGRQTVTWSGTEEVGMWRICGKPPPASCVVTRVTVPGTYSAEACAHTGVSLGGARDCRRVDFSHPARSPIVLRFGP